MKNILSTISRLGLFPRLTAIAVLCIALPVRAALPYPTASSAIQLGADINYANTNGGTFTIYLQPNTGFTNGGGAIGGTKTVNLTIIGNGITFYGLGYNPSLPNYNYLDRFFEVAAGSSLTLEQMTLQNGYVYETYGGAIINSGTLTISNCTLSGNTCYDSDYVSSLTGYGGAIANFGGTVIIDNSILSSNYATGDLPAGGAIYNESGMVTISNSTFIDNIASDSSGQGAGAGGAIYNAGTMTISHSSFTGNAAAGDGGIYNDYGGTVTVENSSRISGNAPDDVANEGTLYLDSSSVIDILTGNPAIIVQGSGPSPSPLISLTRSNTIVVSWPYPSNGWSLQQNNDLRTTNWVTSTNTVANDGTNNFIIAAASLDQLFFRLKF
jgi:hypothetical protein